MPFYLVTFRKNWGKLKLYFTKTSRAWERMFSEPLERSENDTAKFFCAHGFIFKNNLIIISTITWKICGNVLLSHKDSF